MPFNVDARAVGSPGGAVSAAQRGPLVLRNLGIVALLFIAGIAMSFGFSLVGLEPEASFLLFIVGILIASLETDSGLWGIVLGIMYLLVYDLFFALPHLSLLIFNWTDAVTLVIFAVVALITGALTNRMKQQVEIAERNALVLRRLNKISAGLIDSTSAEGACAFASDALCSVLGREVSISLGRPVGDATSLECYEQGYQTGAGAGGPAGCTTLYVPPCGESPGVRRGDSRLRRGRARQGGALVFGFRHQADRHCGRAQQPRGACACGRAEDRTGALQDHAAEERVP